MLRKLRSWIRLPEQKSKDGFLLPFGLSPRDYERLRTLVSSDDFALLTKTLDKSLTLYCEQLLGISDIAQFNFLRGKILGIREAVEFVDTLETKEKDYRIREQERERTKHWEPGQRRVGTFGTSAWNPRAD